MIEVDQDSAGQKNTTSRSRHFADRIRNYLVNANLNGSYNESARVVRTRIAQK